MTVPASGPLDPAWPDVLLWFDTIDAIIRGLGHSLNNRALALGATLQSLDPRRPVDAQASAALSRESERLAEHLRQLRNLPFAADREPMPLLLREVLTGALQLHRSHASLGEVSCFLEGSSDAPPVLAPESALLHATLVQLTALKGFAAPGGVVRVTFDGTPEQATVSFVADRDPDQAGAMLTAVELVRPTALASALLRSARLEITQRIGPTTAEVTWQVPSLRAMRRMARGG